MDFELTKTEEVFNCVYNGKEYILTAISWAGGTEEDMDFEVITKDGKEVPEKIANEIIEEFLRG